MKIAAMNYLLNVSEKLWNKITDPRFDKKQAQVFSKYVDKINALIVNHIDEAICECEDSLLKKEVSCCCADLYPGFTETVSKISESVDLQKCYSCSEGDFEKVSSMLREGLFDCQCFSYEKDQLECEKVVLEDMIASVPEESVIEKVSLESRLTQVNEQLSDNNLQETTFVNISDIAEVNSFLKENVIANDDKSCVSCDCIQSYMEDVLEIKEEQVFTKEEDLVVKNAFVVLSDESSTSVNTVLKQVDSNEAPSSEVKEDSLKKEPVKKVRQKKKNK